ARRRGVDPRLEGRRERLRGRRVRTAARRRRRHHAGAQLADHPLAELGVLVDRGGVEPFERHAAGFGIVVVARRAILADEAILRIDGKGRRNGGALGGQTEAETGENDRGNDDGAAHESEKKVYGECGPELSAVVSRKRGLAPAEVLMYQLV